MHSMAILFDLLTVRVPLGGLNLAFLDTQKSICDVEQRMLNPPIDDDTNNCAGDQGDNQEKERWY